MAMKSCGRLSLAQSLAKRYRVHSRNLVSVLNPKEEGDISSVFSSLSGKVAEPLPDRFARLKTQFVRGNEATLTASWSRLLRRLATENQTLARKGSSVIPQIDFQDLESNPQGFADEVKYRGVAVIRGVVPPHEARGYKEQVEEYVMANPSTKAFPQDKPAVFELYWSSAQIKARSHPNLITTQKYLMSLWHSEDPEAAISTANPLVYADRVRIRQPGDAGFALGPHIDGGSVERWEPEGYGLGHVYDKIFSGLWEEYDPWESSCRLKAITDLYNGPGSCSMYRMFQGWLSMSETAPNEGTLMVNPLLQLSTAYLLLRPFFTPLRSLNINTPFSSKEDYLRDENWILEPQATSNFQGASPGVSQELTDILHPHLDLANTMVHVPKINPGDYVVWHCDTIHAVDRVHNGLTDSSVLYIPVCPLTETNLEYLARQRETFINGFPGPDFPGGKGESEHYGRPSLQYLMQNVGIEGLRAMGFEKFTAENSQMVESSVHHIANKRLGLV